MSTNFDAAAQQRWMSTIEARAPETLLGTYEFGDRWLTEARSAILLVPSVVARLEWNAMVNPAHPDARQLTLSRAEKVMWDRRLFERPVVL